MPLAAVAPVQDPFPCWPQSPQEIGVLCEAESPAHPFFALDCLWEVCSAQKPASPNCSVGGTRPRKVLPLSTHTGDEHGRPPTTASETLRPPTGRTHQTRRKNEEGDHTRGRTPHTNHLFDKSGNPIKKQQRSKHSITPDETGCPVTVLVHFSRHCASRTKKRVVPRDRSWTRPSNVKVCNWVVAEPCPPSSPHELRARGKVVRV